MRCRILAFAGPDGKHHDLNVCHLRGLLTRIGAKIAAYTVAIRVNRHFDRPNLAFATLVV